MTIFTNLRLYAEYNPIQTKLEKTKKNAVDILPQHKNFEQHKGLTSRIKENDMKQLKGKDIIEKHCLRLRLHQASLPAKC